MKVKVKLDNVELPEVERLLNAVLRQLEAINTRVQSLETVIRTQAITPEVVTDWKKSAPPLGDPRNAAVSKQAEAEPEQTELDLPEPEQPEPEPEQPEPEQTDITAADINKILLDIFHKMGSRDAIDKLLKKYGAAGIREVDEDSYTALYLDARKLLEKAL